MTMAQDDHLRFLDVHSQRVHIVPERRSFAGVEQDAPPPGFDPEREPVLRLQAGSGMIVR